METTRELYQAAKVASGAKSDYAFAQMLGVTRSACSQYLNGKSTFDDTHAAKIAGILGREPGEIMAICAAERSKDEGNRARWLRVAALVAAAVIPPAAGAAVDNNGPFGRLLSVQSTDYAQLRRAIMAALFGRSGRMTAA